MQSPKFTIQEQINIWKSWQDQYGFVSNKAPGVQTHNGIMFTAEYVFWLNRMKSELPETFYESERERINALIESCYVENGGFKRAPSGWTSYHLNQNDDYFGLAMISRLFGFNFSERAYRIMQMNWGCLNDQNPGVFSFKSNLARMPQLTVTLMLSAQLSPSLWGLLFWVVWLYSSLARGNRDSAVKGWMASHAAYGFNSKLDNLIRFYWYLFKKKNVGIGAREYFSVAHPSRLLMWDWV